MSGAPAIGDGGARGDAGHRQPVDERVQHRRLTAMKMIGAHRVDDDAVRRVGCDDRREALQNPNSKAVQCFGVRCRIDIVEDDGTLLASCSGSNLGLLIGKHGQTIDAIQYLVNAIVWRSRPDDRKEVVVDAAGYRERRRAALESLAVRSAEEALATHSPVELEPMTAVERKTVHLRLKEFDGVETGSEGTEPNRFVVISPTG